MSEPADPIADEGALPPGMTISVWRFAPMTALLILSNIVVALAMASSARVEAFEPEMVFRFGGADAVSIWAGELWRLLAASWVHAAWWHLVLNMLGLLALGRLLEGLIGSSRFLLVYCFAGLAGFAASVAFAHGYSTGASGSIFGVLGGLLALGVVWNRLEAGRQLLQDLLPFVVGNLALAVLVPFVDNVVHVVGGLAGFALTLGLVVDDAHVLAARADEPGTEINVARRNLVSQIVVAACIAAIVVGVLYAQRPVFSPRYHAIEAVRLRNLDTTAAQMHLLRAQQLAPHDDIVAVAAVLVHAPTPSVRGAARSAETAGVDDIVKGLRLNQVSAADPPMTDTEAAMVVCRWALGADPAQWAVDAANICAWQVAIDPAAPAAYFAEAKGWAAVAVDRSQAESSSVLHTLAMMQLRLHERTQALRTLEVALQLEDGDLPRSFLLEERDRVLASKTLE